MTCENCEAQKKRVQELLQTIVRLTNETPYPDEVKDALAQRGTLLAEIGTLKSRLSALEMRIADIADENVGMAPTETAEASLTRIEKEFFANRKESRLLQMIRDLLELDT